MNDCLYFILHSNNIHACVCKQFVAIGVKYRLRHCFKWIYFFYGINYYG